MNDILDESKIAKKKSVNAALALSTPEECHARAVGFLDGYEKRLDDSRLLKILCPKAKQTYLKRTAPYIDHQSSNAHVMLTYPYRQWPDFGPVAYPTGSVKLYASNYGNNTEAAIVPLSSYGERLCQLVDYIQHIRVSNAPRVKLNPQTKNL